jgi:hypothetical protein
LPLKGFRLGQPPTPRHFFASSGVCARLVWRAALALQRRRRHFLSELYQEVSVGSVRESDVFDEEDCVESLGVGLTLFCHLGFQALKTPSE